MVDKEGVTHYGDHVPPEYATQEQHVLNSEGYEIRRQEAQKSAEQTAADDQKKLDADNVKFATRTAEHLCLGAGNRTAAGPAAHLAGRSNQGDQSVSRHAQRPHEKMRTDSQRFKPYNSDPKAPSMPDQVAEDLVRLTTTWRSSNRI